MAGLRLKKFLLSQPCKGRLRCQLADFFSQMYKPLKVLSDSREEAPKKRPGFPVHLPGFEYAPLKVHIWET